MTDSDSSLTPTAAGDAIETSHSGDDSDSAGHRTPEHGGESTWYLRSARPFRSLSTGGLVVAGPQGTAFLLEPGAELIWETLIEAKRLPEILTELEALARQPPVVAAPGGRVEIGDPTARSALGSEPSPNPHHEVVLALLDELVAHGIVDVI